MFFKEVRNMNQIKIGEFLKELRKEKGLTQEQLAEQFNVSRRSVSRWETGNNMPDLDTQTGQCTRHKIIYRIIKNHCQYSKLMI